MEPVTEPLWREFRPSSWARIDLAGASQPHGPDDQPEAAYWLAWAPTSLAIGMILSITVMYCAEDLRPRKQLLPMSTRCGLLDGFTKLTNR